MNSRTEEIVDNENPSHNLVDDNRNKKEKRPNVNKNPKNFFTAMTPKNFKSLNNDNPVKLYA